MSACTTGVCPLSSDFPLLVASQGGLPAVRLPAVRYLIDTPRLICYKRLTKPRATFQFLSFRLPPPRPDLPPEGTACKERWGLVLTGATRPVTVWRCCPASKAAENTRAAAKDNVEMGKG